ncbi:DNA polymerase III, subunits gamma and tau [Hydrogenobacter thermophilus TK-6]|uniref:DNA polymerase III subunit gamma/tau n=1 Tax=Hydrogenobacter thermophilus (strain DSM 6534 / IAM 12695 / TK-6) TaxID=608538 RepID=D3DGE3_HYDTT|nr:DNA polymerase III subunit gamma/tau [Hydrogenobacter thermophilus]ADO44831.1 DNA polymerase III, subunits gamma and tau [Hydrogenobacter thermophilus TK-6]BAI68895.1 DNA polymerase III gamma/tau subunit [Hydrogenobacter thermophilus TK-6]
MYIPFARKYRPKFFKDVVGQEPVKRILLNAVRLQKVSSAYIFAGSRGTGKTTVARLLTKSLNCINLQESGEPCGQCENCLSIDRGSFPDLIEIDAASSRGIDDIRAIRDAVSYTPIKGRYKVYILDEAHMLTKEAFNALLKTLEEPPPRTVFILCTTEYEKIIPTILSRCQRLIFTKLSQEEIVQRLKHICQEENISYDEKSLITIAKLSDGGMRDAVSLLDQVSTYAEGNIKEGVLEEFLGIVSQERVREFLRMLLESRVDEAIDFLRQITTRGFNLVRFWDALEDEIRMILLYRSLKDPSKVIKVEDFHRSMSQVPINALLYLEKVINTARADAKTRDFLRACELAIIKTLVVKDIIPVGELFKRTDLHLTKEDAPQEVSLKDKVINEVEKAFGVLEAQRLKNLEAKEEKGRITFLVPESEAKTIDINRIKTRFPEIDFEILSSSKENKEELPEFSKKVKDLFGAKVIKHGKGDKGKDTSG